MTYESQEKKKKIKQTPPKDGKNFIAMNLRVKTSINHLYLILYIVKEYQQESTEKMK